MKYHASVRNLIITLSAIGIVPVALACYVPKNIKCGSETPWTVTHQPCGNVVTATRTCSTITDKKVSSKGLSNYGSATASCECTTSYSGTDCAGQTPSPVYYTNGVTIWVPSGSACNQNG